MFITSLKRTAAISRTCLNSTGFKLKLLDLIISRSVSLPRDTGTSLVRRMRCASVNLSGFIASSGTGGGRNGGGEFSVGDRGGAVGSWGIKS